MSPWTEVKQREDEAMARQVLMIRSAEDGGCVVLGKLPIGPALIPGQIMASVYEPPLLFAGSLQECADYIVREMSPLGADDPAVKS